MTGAVSIELLYLEGNPDGLCIALGPKWWIGSVLRIPRTKLSEATKLPQADQVGVYVLIGEKDGIETIYVGETTSFAKRAINHEAQKDWWNTAIFVTSTGNDFNKADAEYLEARLIEEAKHANTPMDNNQGGKKSTIALAATFALDRFIQDLLKVLPALRVDCFSSGSIKASAVASNLVEATFELYSKKHGVSGTAVWKHGEFIVLAGAKASLNWIGKNQDPTGYEKHRVTMLKKGQFSEQGGYLVLQQDFAFSSPTAAAQVLLGRSSNGRVEWKLSGNPGQNFGDWEDQKIQDAQATNL